MIWTESPMKYVWLPVALRGKCLLMMAHKTKSLWSAYGPCVCLDSDPCCTVDWIMASQAQIETRCNATGETIQSHFQSRHVQHPAVVKSVTWSRHDQAVCSSFWRRNQEQNDSKAWQQLQQRAGKATLRMKPARLWCTSVSHFRQTLTEKNSSQNGATKNWLYIYSK